MKRNVSVLSAANLAVMAATAAFVLPALLFIKGINLLSKEH